MAHLTVELPEELRSKLKSRAAETGHHSLAQYVQALLRCEADATDVNDEEYGGPDHVTAHSAEELEALLLEGENIGPATEMIAADWESIRQEVAARIANQCNSKAG